MMYIILYLFVHIYLYICKIFSGCIWCETQTSGIPFCFNDGTISQGGEMCPSYIPAAERYLFIFDSILFEYFINL